jgi:hypothetical protein
MTERLNEFMNMYGTRNAFKSSLGALRDGSPEEAGEAGQNLERMINGVVGTQLITPNTEERMLLLAGGKAERRFDRLGLEKFNSDPEGMIADALAGHADKFKANYLAVQPYEIGVEEHDRAAQSHIVAHNIRGAISQIDSNQSPGAYAQFIRGTIGYVTEDVKQHLGGDDPEELHKVVAAIYATTDPRHARSMAANSMQNALGRVEALLPEDRRTEYAANNLRKLAGDNARDASQALYTVVASR